MYQNLDIANGSLREKFIAFYSNWKYSSNLEKNKYGKYKEIIIEQKLVE